MRLENLFFRVRELSGNFANSCENLELLVNDRELLGNFENQSLQLH